MLAGFSLQWAARVFRSPKPGPGPGFLVLFSVGLFLDKTPAASGFNHSYPWVIGFHGFRIATLAALLVASAHFLAVRHLLKTAGAGASRILHPGRNYLLLAAVLFLTAEYCGLVWCQNGWGDIWHWSPGFFQSTLILLYLMVAFHVPPPMGSCPAGSSFSRRHGRFFCAVHDASKEPDLILRTACFRCVDNEKNRPLA